MSGLYGYPPAGPLSASAAAARDAAAAAAIAQARMRPELQKTELCTNFARTGSCRYGASCRFAHGEQELRSRLRDASYKSQPCPDALKPRTAAAPPVAAVGAHAAAAAAGVSVRAGAVGLCAYGSRCDYAHPGDAIRRVRADGELAKRGAFTDAAYEMEVRRNCPDTLTPWGFYL